jgi:hypothetical protein
MADSLMPKFILVVTFIGVFAIVSSVFPEVLGSETTKPIRPSMEEIADELQNITVWAPEPWPVTNSYVDDGLTFDGPFPKPGFEDSNKMAFTKAGESNVNMWLIRDSWFYLGTWVSEEDGNYRDFLYFETSYSGGLWIGKHHRSAIIPLDEILDGFNDDTNFSRVDFKLRYQLTIWITYENTTWEDFEEALYANEYNVTLGNANNIVVSDSNPWGLIAKIMTFSLPGMPYILDIMIATPVYAMIIYLAISVVTRFIPTIPGL